MQLSPYKLSAQLNISALINREYQLFEPDFKRFNKALKSAVSSSKFLVLGGAGTIGQSVVKEIFTRNPLKLHVVDISENNLVELVRDIRSSYGYIDGDFKTFALDIGSATYNAFIASDGKYDYVLNLSALKHVRSEKDPFTLMRMVETNILNTIKTIEQSIANDVKKYFCVSTDKATNPVNMMGASKRIMELFLMQKSEAITISTARFPNVAFSDGSLLYGFEQRIKKQQPIAAPSDIERYFITPKSAGELCLMACIFGKNRDVFFPKLNNDLRLTKFTDIAYAYLKNIGYIPQLCTNEAEARALAKTLPETGKWPCFFSKTNTTGEKAKELFYNQDDTLDLEEFNAIGVIKNIRDARKNEALQLFIDRIHHLKKNNFWTKEDVMSLFKHILPNFKPKEIGMHLDDKM